MPFFSSCFLQVLLLLVTTYAIGSEGKFGTSFLSGCRLPGGEYVDSHYREAFAVYDYLYSNEYPLLIIFTLAYSIYRWIADSGPLNLTSALFVLSTQALAVFPFFPISVIEYHYQRCVNGGFVGSYSFRSSHFPYRTCMHRCIMLLICFLFVILLK